MRSESTSALGQPRLTTPILCAACDMGLDYRENVRGNRRLYVSAGRLAGPLSWGPSTRRKAIMGQQINLPTTRTQCIGAYLAQPEGKPKGGIVVIQEIFGVNAHMRRVADGFAE